MKHNEIYVAPEGHPGLALTTGKGLAVFPPRKEEAKSYVLMDSGRVVTLKGARINGVGVPRFLEQSGFVRADQDNPRAAQLADWVDMRDAVSLVEKASEAQARQLQAQFGGQICTYVPFNPERNAVKVRVEPLGLFQTTVFDLRTGFSCAAVSIEYDRATGFGTSVALSEGWLIGPDASPEDVPVNTEYGGLVELAVYILCNCGIATLTGPKHLEMDENATEDALYPRGMLLVTLNNGDQLRVGIDGCDELGVDYLRNGVTIYSRAGMPEVRLAEVIGAIAAPLVRVSEMDAIPTRKARTKKAA